ncbi:MAG: alanine--tRNA ligase [bacterium]
MRVISSNELREIYQRFFEEKGHRRIPSAPLVPVNDPSVLFTTAGMHPLVPYLKGEPHPQGDKLTDVQKCLRTTDIDEVGDATHATVFEMLGNWSLGCYFKEDAIKWSWEFLTGKKWLDIDPDYLAVSVFEGSDNAPRDEESAGFWRAVGVPAERIAYLDSEDNWWPAYTKASAGQGPQGPDTEMFYWVGSNKPPKEFDPDDKNWVEIWNDVFMEYDGQEDGSLKQLAQKNVDTGMGLERTVMVLNGLKSIYEIDSYVALMSEIEKSAQHRNERHERIVADHIKAAAFILGDENPVMPSNVERGYVLRRLIRRAVRSAWQLGVKDAASLFDAGLGIVIMEFKQTYPSLNKHKNRTRNELKSEIDKSETAIKQGEPIARKLIESKKISYGGLGFVTGVESSTLWQSYGYPLEMLEDMAKEEGVKVDKEEHLQKEREHQEKSRSAAAGKFAGGLADQSEQATKYHTATHLLHQALREVLGDHVLQRGSNITAERLRFDFSHPKKTTPEELEQVEEIINDKIAKDLLVTREEMTVKEAKERGALGLFENKYDDRVSVYVIGDYSAEICGGPHVKRIGELGTFKIKKEESSSAGIRRIRAVLI